MKYRICQRIYEPASLQCKLQEKKEEKIGEMHEQNVGLAKRLYENDES